MNLGMRSMFVFGRGVWRGRDTDYYLSDNGDTYIHVHTNTEEVLSIIVDVRYQSVNATTFMRKISWFRFKLVGLEHSKTFKHEPLVLNET